MHSLEDLLAIDAGIDIPARTTAVAENRRAYKTEYDRNLRSSVREIGALPPIEDNDRRTECHDDFKSFCKTYFSDVFVLPWSDDHLVVIDKLERSILKGGLFALAMPRGSGKTSLCETACLWALIYGHRQFICYIGAESGLAEQALDSIKAELETNELLQADFPEVCYPIEKLERIAMRCKGQTYQGEPTYIGWHAKKLVLPTIPGSVASGAVVRIAGLTGQLRGMKHKKPDGESIRPDLVILDDPQTDESARSESQCAQRESLLSGAILNLGGPGKKIAGVMPCTVIKRDDMAQRILDRSKHPEWQGELMRLVYEWPENEELWVKYKEMREEELAADGDGSKATEFYKKNRKEMDKGSRIAWPERHNYDELSALQHAYNLRFRDEEAFFSEYQNDPLPEYADEEDASFRAKDVLEKVVEYRRGTFSPDHDHVVSFIDVQKYSLYYLVLAARKDFTCQVVEYGIYPDQGDFREYSDLKTTLFDLVPDSLDGALYAGLKGLDQYLHSRTWGGLKLGLTLVDANWGESTDLVYSYCHETGSRIMPSHGKYVGAASQPMEKWAGKATSGLKWRVPKVTKRQVKHVVYDTNFYKSFALERTRTKRGVSGDMTYHAGQHKMLIRHLVSEYRLPVEVRGRKVYEWQHRPERFDNHWLDCLAGSCVAASMVGCTAPGYEMKRKVKPQQPRDRVSYL